jgi:hypothetical protein
VLSAMGDQVAVAAIGWLKEDVYTRRNDEPYSIS